MFSPENMKAAMDMMKNMDQDQLQRMMGAMGNVNPDMMAQAQQMAQNMTPDQWAQARQAMDGMTPEQLQGISGQAASQLSAQQKYVLTASQQLKNEGNQLYSSGRYAEAIEKYQRAKQNVLSFTSTDAAELRKACTLNLASCYLAQKQWSQCIDQCNEVLPGDPENLKALYRRGQAYMGTQSWEQAVNDLSRAVKLSSHDPSQQKLIKDKLQDAKDQLSAQRASAALQQPSQTNSDTANTTANVNEPIVTEPDDIPTPQSAQRNSGGTAATPSQPMLDPSMLKAAVDEMRRNPNWAQQVQQQMQNMSDEQLRALGQQFGHDLRREHLTADWANRLQPDQLEKLAQWQSQLQDSKLAERLRANPQDPEALAATSRMLQQNPEMVNTMADMLTGMSPDQLNDMARQMGMPPGSLNADMIKTAASTFKNMKSEELQAMTEMAAKFRPPTATTNSTTTTNSNQARSSTTVPTQLQNGSANVQTSTETHSNPAPSAPMPGMPAMTPDMMSKAAEMMSSMPPEQLQQMMSSMGAAGAAPNLTPEMAKMAADMMSKMSPEDIQRMSSMMGSGMLGQAAAGGSPASGMPAGGAGMADMMSRMDPKMLDNAFKMMRSMPPDQMADMMMQSGMVKDREQAKLMAERMQGMSDTQLQMMAKAANVVQKGAQAVQKTKEFVRGRAWLVIGILILLLAIFLRWLGWM